VFSKLVRDVNTRRAAEVVAFQKTSNLVNAMFASWRSKTDFRTRILSAKLSKIALRRKKDVFKRVVRYCQVEQQLQVKSQTFISHKEDQTKRTIVAHWVNLLQRKE